MNSPHIFVSADADNSVKKYACFGRHRLLNWENQHVELQTPQLGPLLGWSINTNYSGPLNWDSRSAQAISNYSGSYRPLNWKTYVYWPPQTPPLGWSTFVGRYRPLNWDDQHVLIIPIECAITANKYNKNMLIILNEGSPQKKTKHD
jgi:hypothetical protein